MTDLNKKFHDELNAAINRLDGRIIEPKVTTCKDEVTTHSTAPVYVSRDTIREILLDVLDDKNILVSLSKYGWTAGLTVGQSVLIYEMDCSDFFVNQIDRDKGTMVLTVLCCLDIEYPLNGLFGNITTITDDLKELQP